MNEWAALGLKFVTGIAVAVVGFVFVDFQHEVRSQFDKVSITIANIYNEVRELSLDNAVMMEIVRRHDIDIAIIKVPRGGSTE